MNRWGVEGCKARRTEIVEWLEEERKLAGWSATLSAGVAAISRGWIIDPMDPCGWLVDKAIREAEEELATKS
jgi:hypothetical protein